MSVAALQPTVAIVLCTYNGAEHIQEQMDSLLAQSWTVVVRVFDDSSCDETVQLLEPYKDKLAMTITINPENIGYVANFEAGIAQVLSEGFQYIALCDQDDVWHCDRIATGMRRVQAIENQFDHQVAVLAHSDLRMIDSSNNCVHPSYFDYRLYEIDHNRSLPTVLGQNGVMGNTILMNRTLAAMSYPFPQQLHVHDYWLAVLAEMHGHRILLERTLVDYRIHDDNASNSTESIKFGASKLFDGKSWRGFITRDFRLPFKEDVRLNVIDVLLGKDARFPEPTEEQAHLLTVFRNYLVFDGARFTLLRSMMSNGFFRKGLRHRIRLVFSTLLTKRYD